MKQRRPGVTLLEVLVSIFIMGIGTLAILVLFPLGALNMGRALKDDRCGSISTLADFMAQSRNLRSDATVRKFLNQGPPTPGWAPPPNYLPTSPNRPGYPVIIDPYYALNSLPPTSQFVGPPPPPVPGNAVAFKNSPVQRIVPGYISGAVAPTSPALETDRWFSFLDDLLFDVNGQPVNANGGGLQRQGYYTFSYCVQCTQAANLNSAILTVIVYQGRPVQSPTQEPAFHVSPPGNQGDTGVTLVWPTGTPPPELRRGNWLMDYTPVVTPSGKSGYSHCQFYRVMDAYQTSANSMAVEVYPALVDNQVKQMVVMEYAIEIFYRGLGR